MNIDTVASRSTELLAAVEALVRELPDSIVEDHADAIGRVIVALDSLSPGALVGVPLSTEGYAVVRKGAG